MKFRHLLLAGAASAALIGPAQVRPVAAETLPMVPQTGVVALSDFFYMSIGGTAQVVETPKFNYGRNQSLVTAELSDAFSERTRVITGGPAIVFGYNLPFWENTGMRPRIEFAGMANFGMARTSTFSSVPIATRATYFTNLDDGTVAAVGFPDTQAFALRMTYANADGAVRMKADLALGPMFTLTPSVGAIFGFTQTKYDLTGRNTFAGVIEYTNRLEETMTSWRGGAELGLDATLSLGSMFKLHGGITGAAYYQHVRITGRDCTDVSVTPGAPACAGIVPLPIRTGRASDDGLGARAGASLGATVSTGWMNVTFMGTGSYNINSPQVENPRFPEQPSKGVKVGWEDRFSYGGYIMATFPLN